MPAIALGPDLESIVARLKAEASVFRAVGGSANLDAAMRTQQLPPNSAYVLPDKESGGENSIASGGYSQNAKIKFAVLIIARNVADARAASAHGDLRLLRAAAFNALANWVPPWASLPIEWDSGALADVRPGEMWWEDLYRTELILEN
jgi:hypothetical protein